MIEKTFSANSESLNAIQDFISDWGFDNSVAPKIITKLSVCNDEIISNIINYSKATFIQIGCSIEDNILTVVFTDDGIPFDPLTEADEPDITASAEDRKIGGLGIFMVKKMMDSVQYSRVDNKNILTITKSLTV